MIKNFSMQWESEVLFFMLVIIMFRTRKSGSRNLLAYISVFNMYAKVCNVVLWFSCDIVYGIIYIILVISKTINGYNLFIKKYCIVT